MEDQSSNMNTTKETTMSTNETPRTVVTMSDDLIDRLGCAYLTGDVPCEACTFCAARVEIERLREQNDYLKANVEMLLAEATTPTNPHSNVRYYAQLLKKISNYQQTPNSNAIINPTNQHQ